jgi:hypothetical protein
MSLPTESRRTVSTGREHPRAPEVVSRLVADGLVEPGRAGEARASVSAVLSGRAGTQTSLRGRLAEVSGYVGGALVVAAAVVFLSQEWASMSATARVATLAVIGVVLLGAAVVALRTGRAVGSDAAGSGDRAVRRRLASALTCGAAAALGFAVAVAVDARTEDFSDVPWLAGTVAAVVVAAGGYLLAHSALGQLALAAGALLVIQAGIEFTQARSELAYGLLVLALGLVWLALAELGIWRESYVGLATGCALVLLGAQLMAFGETAWAGYLATGAVAAAAVVMYVRRRALPYLVTAVAGVTLVVPEALLDWTDGSLGPVGVLLVSGVTLLAAGLLGLRLRQEVGPSAPPGAEGEA